MKVHHLLKIDPKLKIIEMWWKTSMNLGGRFFHKTPSVVKRSLDDLDLLRAPGPHDDGVRCVCLVHQLSSPAMRFSGNPWEQKLPPDVLFFRKKTTRALLPGRFSAKIGKKPFFTCSENGTLLITYGFCGGVPTQNGGNGTTVATKNCGIHAEQERSLLGQMEIRNLQKKHQNLISGSTLPLMTLFTSANRWGIMKKPTEISKSFWWHPKFWSSEVWTSQCAPRLYCMHVYWFLL